jgi:branched-subunit amino acid aminotransferase/4-amino-4-deoxychorismate lyase
MGTPATNSVLYSKGVFTTVAIHEGTPISWDKHLARLQRDMAMIGIDRGEVSENSLLGNLLAELERSEIVDGRARITISDETPSPIWYGETEKLTSVQIIVGSRRPLALELSLTQSSYPVNSRSPLAGVKSCNYLENMMAIDEAKGRGFNEAIRLNERGEVTSGCMANVFWVKGGDLFTPSLKTGCLPGTTREYVLENLECREVEAGIGDLRAADAIFLTSAGLGIVEVAEFESRKPASRHPILNLWPPALTQ